MNLSDKPELEKGPIPALVRFYEAILGGDTGALIRMFQGEPQINTPLHGDVKGEPSFHRFLIEQRDWLLTRQADPHFIDIVIGERRLVLEYSLDLTQGSDTFDLPVAIVADREGAGVSALRVYHSTWPLTGEHHVRPPILPLPEEKLPQPAVIEAYMDGLRRGDKDKVMSLFTEDGYVRQPSGERFKHVGRENLRAFYDPALDDGGIGLHHCTATFDGHTFAVEFICDEWANVKLPPQAGLAVYELAGRDKMKAARIYDDVNPPMA
jgi:hypothetical protein